MAGAEFESAERGQVVTRSQLANILGVNIKTITIAVKEGLPAVTRETHAHLYNTAECIRWFRQRAIERATAKYTAKHGDFEDAKTAHMNAAGRLKELKIAELEGKLLPVDHVTRWVQRAFANVRSRVLQVESQIMGLSPEQREEVKVALNDALADLSTDSLGVQVDNGDEFESDSSPENRSEFEED